MLILTRRDVDRLAEPAEILEAVEAAFRAHGMGQVHMPPRVYLDVQATDGGMWAMPAFVNGAAGVKWGNSHPDNPKRHNLPTVMAVMVYNDPATGLPLSIMDGTTITKLRTAATTVVASKHLASPGAGTLGIIGCGAQAMPHITYFRRVFDFEHIYLYDQDAEAAEHLAAAVGRIAVPVRSAREAAEAEIICTLTPGHSIVLRDEWVKPGRHINAIGADALGKQELEVNLLHRARVFVDDIEQATHSGELSTPIAHGLYRRESITGTLGQVVAGLIPGRTAPAQITVFDSSGLAIEDVATARYLYDKAVAAHQGTRIDLL
ncbi:MAG: ornithine cyclodeaminase family protein [Bacillota bacterium]|nr:ornithine cyclodeaminase family protein [Bacillota bacterium]